MEPQIQAWELRFKPGAQIQAWRLRFKPGGSDSSLEAQILTCARRPEFQSLGAWRQGIQGITSKSGARQHSSHVERVVLKTTYLATLAAEGHVKATPVEGLGGLRNHTSGVGGI